jgi:hypothetical protein
MNRFAKISLAVVSIFALGSLSMGQTMKPKPKVMTHHMMAQKKPMMKHHHHMVMKHHPMVHTHHMTTMHHSMTKHHKHPMVHIVKHPPTKMVPKH